MAMDEDVLAMCGLKDSRSESPGTLESEKASRVIQGWEQQAMAWWNGGAVAHTSRKNGTDL